jgi:hypothetical protein
MAGYQIRSALATRLVNLDRLRFNEAVALGHYSCAPATLQGQSRIFDEDDLVTLYVFARLLERGFATRAAGNLACEFRSAMRTTNYAKAARIILCHDELSSYFTADLVAVPNGVEEKYNPDRKSDYAGGRVVMTTEFYVANIRQNLAERVARERKILGSEDDE